MVFSPDNQTFNTLNLDGSVSLWDAASKQETVTHAGLGTNNTSLAISNDGNLLAVGAATGSIKVWNRVTQRELTNFIGHATQVEYLQFRSNSRILVSAASDRTVKLWDVKTWRVQTVCRIDHRFGQFEASMDGRLAAVTEADKVNLWNLATGKQEASLAGDWDWVDGVAFSPDGRLLAAASQNGSTVLFEAGSWREVARLRGVLLGFKSVTFAPDGRRLATGSSPKEAIKLWDLATRQEVLTLEVEGTESLWFTAFSPDGNTLVGSHGQGMAQLWCAPPLAEIDAKVATRPQ